VSWPRFEPSIGAVRRGRVSIPRPRHRGSEPTLVERTTVGSHDSEPTLVERTTVASHDGVDHPGHSNGV